MHSVNPMVIPRNHKVEEALAAANNGDLEVMNKLLIAKGNPEDILININQLTAGVESNEKYQTFCGT